MHETSWYCTHCGAANNEQAQFCFACKQARSEFQEQLLHGRYQTVSVVGTGGFGMVYKALDVQVANHIVAVKQIHLRGLPPQKAIEATDAFNREIQILTLLNNPHLPRIYDSFTDPEHWYLVMSAKAAGHPTKLKGCPAIFQLCKRILSCNRLPDNQSMNIVGSFVGVDRLQVIRVATDWIFQRDAVRAQH